MATQSKDPWPNNISQNQKKLDRTISCPTCGYEGKGWVREYYGNAGAPLRICPECRSGH